MIRSSGIVATALMLSATACAPAYQTGMPTAGYYGSGSGYGVTPPLAAALPALASAMSTPAYAAPAYGYPTPSYGYSAPSYGYAAPSYGYASPAYSQPVSNNYYTTQPQTGYIPASAPGQPPRSNWGRRDSDHDGVPNRVDRHPYTPADRDHNGIPNRFDRHPNTPKVADRGSQRDHGKGADHGSQRAP
jgi:hypothetical protein